MTAGEIIQYCQKTGVILIPKQNGRLKFKGPKEVVTDELLASLKAHKSELIQVLTVMDVFNGVIVSGHRETSYSPILCPYNNQARYLHPEVCKWHRDENDPECENCEAGVWGEKVLALPKGDYTWKDNEWKKRTLH